MCLLTLFAVGARAQVPVFDSIDWVLDRGATTYSSVAGQINGAAGTAVAGIALRQGKNNFNQTVNNAVGIPDSGSATNNNPHHAVRRNVFPRTADIKPTGTTTSQQVEVIDNPNSNDPDIDTDTVGNTVRVRPRSTSPAGNDPQLMAHAFLKNAGAINWTTAPNIAIGAAGDYRSPSGGFSFSTDLGQVYTSDYAYLQATHNDFLIARTGGGTSPASQGELAALPYVSTDVYAGVENVLKNTANSTAVWQLGGFSKTPARFTIDIYSPGDGTVINNVAHPNVTRALVRVSYGHKPDATNADDVKTVDANGAVITAGVNDSRYSRLFVVDLGQAGWINIAPGGRSPSAFDYNGDPNYQIVVTLYSLTPDDVTDTSLFASYPLITADAIRFNPQQVTTGSAGLTQTADGNPVSATNPALYSITPSGRILGPAVGTNKYTNASPFNAAPFDVTSNDTQPLVYFAREEIVPDTTPRIPKDPTKPVSDTNPLVPDPTLNVSAPVFYCLDSKNGADITRSVERVRWRYVGLPDTANGSGTASASPLLANVRCRDGKIRTIVYFVTTNATGTIGHIYALDALGSRQDLTTKTIYNTTTAYWVYPSYRPLSLAEQALSKYPDQYHDPNYNNSMKYATGDATVDALPIRDRFGALAAPAWGADSSLGPESKYVDGDIIANPADTTHFIVRSDTQITFPGVQAAPMVIDDPDSPTGAQILVVGGMNGRIYCFDAGGRGDFIYDRAHPNDFVNAATGVPYNLPGTTQRYWTWPHLKADPWHVKFGSGVINTGSNTTKDEADKVAFPSSPAFDPSIGVNNTKFFIGAADGHMFALFSKHDVFQGIDNQNIPHYDERRSWVYPNLTSSATDTQSLGAAPSTPAIFWPTGSNSPNLYFTCNGRVYCITANPPLNGTPTMIPNTKFTWVYPYTNNPPYVNPNDSFSAPLDPSFNGTAPMLLSQAELNATIPGHTAPIPVTKDLCYVVAGDGTVYAINAVSSGAGVVVASGQTYTAGNTSCTPIASLITGIDGFATDTTNPYPSIVFADDDGAIWALSARPDTTTTGVVGTSSLLPVLWAHQDTSSSRLAAASLVNGLIYEGDEGGQLRGYGVGTGAGGLLEPIGIGEPRENTFGIDGDTGNSIDLRGLNLFTSSDYTSITNGTATSARNSTGGALGSSVNPLDGVVDPKNGSTDKTTWPAAIDWGDNLYIVAYGVYHAQPQNNTTGTHAPADATGVPQVQVFLTISQPGQPSINVTLDAQTHFMTPLGGATNGNTWPSDPALAGTNFSIYGIDDPSLERNPMSNTFGEKLTGYTKGVVPYIVWYKLPVLPDGTKPFTPGVAGYRITARAVLTQSVYPNSDATAPVSRSENSNFLQLGQHNYAGLVPINGDGTTASAANPVRVANPNQINTIGRRRDVIITNPIGLTVRQYTGAPGNAADDSNGKLNMIGMGPSAQAISNLLEVIGNGNRIANPYVQAASSPIKPIFAPVGMIPHGSGATYNAYDNNGRRQPSFYIADRSNLASAGRHLRIRVVPKPLRWLGGASSVMNPLPWDLLPNDAEDSVDYPNLPVSGLSVSSALNGQDAINGTVALTQPTYPNANKPETRVVVPTEFKMTVNVPKFQPANVNRGATSWRRADGHPINFGSNYTDIGGNTITRLTGPLNTVSGNTVGLNSLLVFPAGGYVGQMVVEAVPNGATNATVRFNPQAIFNDTRGDATTNITQAYRALEVGASVPPSIKMRVVEQTIDLGKLPHGAGYSDYNGTDYRYPFSPSLTKDWPGVSPWDDESAMGRLFRPFTLINESNVNLYDVRVAKLTADANASAASILPAVLSSDQTTAVINAAASFNSGARASGNIGLVSSFDHVSKLTTGNGAFAERTLWPIANPFVTAAGIADAATAGLQDVDALTAGLLGWKDGLQANPTVHKARVGDTSGIVATIPDTPYDATAGLVTPVAPKVGLAIPLGAPVGTYSAPIYPYEDNIPLQWQEWLSVSGGFGSTGSGYADTSHDGALNAIADPVTGRRSPVEPYSDPTFTLKATVREARLTGGATGGGLAHISTFSQGLLSANPNQPDLLSGPFGANMLPAVGFQPGSNGRSQFNLYWATNAQPNGSPFISTVAPKTGLPVSDAPWSLGYSSLLLGPSGWTFGTSGTGSFANAAWWTAGNGTLGLFPGYDGTLMPAGLATLFPSTPNEATSAKAPYVAGSRIARTVRHASPSMATLTNYQPGAAPPAGSATYLFWQGQIDKLVGSGAGAAGAQVTDSRTFYAPIPSGSFGQPNSGAIQSILNDPALPKLSPKPLYLRLPTTDALYLFWYAGSGSNSKLYYNANTTAPFPSNGWNKDTVLETPDALAWQSEPTPLFHQTYDSATGVNINVIDVVYTGVLKGRRNTETMLSRYQIDAAGGALTLHALPKVIQEQLSRIGSTSSYAARDVAWTLGTGPAGVLQTTDTESQIKLYISSDYGNTITPLVKNVTTDASGDHFPLGQYDQASGLIYYPSTLGGQIVVDPRSGTVSFPQVAPKKTDTIYASYTPQVMRLNTSRDETNIVRTSGFGSYNGADPAFRPRPAITSAGSNTNPIAILERDANERSGLVSPQVVFPNNYTGGFPRLWTLYRKSDTSGSVKSTLYYKAMRLMVRLPRPVTLTNNNGVYSIQNFSVAGNVGPYEVDWVRGRVYFTELDEDHLVTINYSPLGTSGNLTYRVAWGDEISATTQPQNNNFQFIDYTTPEVAVPTDSAVNEGQVTAIQIPSAYRSGPTANFPFLPQQGPELYLFWTSTRAGTTDLFFETIRPNLYPNVPTQR